MTREQAYRRWKKGEDPHKLAKEMGTTRERMRHILKKLDASVPLIDRIEELEAENKRLNEQMDAIEEMGTESLNALPDCLMRLAPALVENDDLKAKLAKAVEALDEAVYLLAPDDKDMARKAGVYRIVTTLAELKGQDDE